MKKFLLHIITVIALLISLPEFLFSQSTIRGFVRTGQDGIPLENVPITIGGDLVGFTDANGNYSFGIASGTNTLSATYNGNTITKNLTFLPGVNWMNFWFNPPDLVSDFDGNYYHTIRIGTQTWMVENLLVTHFNNGTNISSSENNTYYYWYNYDFSSYKDLYGALYNWHAVSTGNLCPSGWHVPSDDEWKILEIALGMTPAQADATGARGTTQGAQLKSTSGWNNNGNGTNSSGFTALPGGYFVPVVGNFYLSGSSGYFWTSTEYDSYESWYRTMTDLNDLVDRSTSNKDWGYSVRCISDVTVPALSTIPVRNSTTNSVDCGGNISNDGNANITARGVCWSTLQNPTTDDSHTTDGTGTGSFTSSITGLNPGTTYYIRSYATNEAGTAYGNEISFTTYKSDAISDIDGNYYNIVNIGAQVWMAENLKTTRYRDGSPIPNITDQSAWAALSTPGYCWYNNDETSYKNTYGALYNWYTVDAASNGNKNLCPTGWHVSTDAEWNTMASFLDPTLSVSGGMLKEAGTTHWLSPNTGATNQSGFTALPGGSRDIYGYFSNIGSNGLWWTSTMFDPGHSYMRGMDSQTPLLGIAGLLTGYGNSVRCVKDYSKPTIVTNINDDGIGSLRDAIQYANSTIGIRDTITFNIPGTGPFTIEPLTLLPKITDPVIIDGFSQPGASSSDPVIMIQLSGVNLGYDGIGLDIYSDDCIIRGLAINRFRIENIGISGIYSSHLSKNNTIKGNFIGTDVTGKNIYPSNQSGIGISVAGDNNSIGGDLPSEKNIVGGNVHGIFITGKSNLVAGNYVGTDISGKLPLMNYGCGILINWASDNIIGGAGPGQRNIISGNNQSGITIQNSTSTGNKVLGNYIGVDVTGQLHLGNGDCGIRIQTEASDNVIGGFNYGEGNVISNNTNDGILIKFTSLDNSPRPTQRNKIQGNLIGTDANGTGAHGNGRNGILLDEFAVLNVIGGTENGAANIIAFNGNAGIMCSGVTNPSSANSILSNLIHSNGSLGIDLGTAGATENDPNDADAGPNYLQNHPVLQSVNYSPGTVTIKGTLNSEPAKNYIIQFFASKTGDETGYGEGQFYLGSKTVTTGINGNASFLETFSLKGIWGTVITATATDPLGNTSEFSHSLGGLQDQIVANGALRFTINQEGVPNITDGSDLDAVRSSFLAWSGIPTADIRFTDGGTTPVKYSSGSDSVNLVSFMDDKFPFSYGVLAVAAKTSRVDPVSQVAKILDADIVVNPDFVNDIRYNLGVGYNNVNAGYFDIQSVITHEIGHVLGLLHTGLVNSTMFFTLGPGITVRTLEQDDKSWASFRYPKQPAYAATYGSISGNIKYGYDNKPVAGALVYAINTATQDSVHAYSDAAGNYLVPGLATGDYNIYIEPLDGNVNNYNLRPGNISSYIYSNTVYTDYPNEFYSGSSEGFVEGGDNKESIHVTAGTVTSNNDLITNKDIIDPTVISVRPTDISGTLVNIISNFSIRFSEPVDETTLSSESCYIESNGKKINGTFTVLNDSVNVVMFDPGSVLDYSTHYTIHITPVIKDLKGNQLQSEFTEIFNTVAADLVAPTINEVIPAVAADSVFVTDKVRVFFSEPMNTSSAEAGFALTTGSGAVDGSFAWDNASTVMTFSPSAPLHEATSYNVSLANSISDLSGNLITASKTYSFSTVEVSPPLIVRMEPGNKLTSKVSVETAVSVDFSEPIDPASVNSSTFTLKSSNLTVPGTFEFLNDNSRVIFRPLASLNLNTSYTISLTDGITDVSPVSQKLTSVSKTFVTETATSVPSITYIDPPYGIVGSEVVIEGTGFDPNPARNIISFNGVSAPVKSASLTTLTTKVPLGATAGPVTVAVSGALSNGIFFGIIPESLQPCNEIIANNSSGSQTSHSVAVTPDGAIAYVTNASEGTVSAIDLRTTNKYSPIHVGNTPMRIEINPKGTKAYVTNFNSHTVSVIDLDKSHGLLWNTVIKTIPVGLQPYGLAVTPDGKRVYVANYYSGDLSVIDENPNSGGFDHVVANVSTGTKPNGTTVTPDGAMVVVTGEFGVEIVNSNPADKDYNSIVANVGSGTKTNGSTVTPDGGLAIVSTEEGHLLVINLHPENNDYSEAVISNVNTGTQVSSIRASGDGLFVYVTSSSEDKLIAYQLGIEGTGSANGTAVTGITLTPHSSTPTGDNPEGIIINADASRLYLVDTKDNLREVATVRLCCGPISPAKEIGDLIINIQSMINNGSMKPAIGNDLISKLNGALLYLSKNQTKNAINALNAVVVKIKDLTKSKQIPADQGNALINSITAIINQLNGPKHLETNDGLIKDDTNASLMGFESIYPNPFNQTVTFKYGIAGQNEAMVKVQILIYDMNGRLVKTLADEMIQQGHYSVTWDGTFDNGGNAPFGSYFVRFRAGNLDQVRKIVFIK